MRIYFVAVGTAAVALAQASTLFGEIFESGNLNQWQPGSSAQIVSDPLNPSNNVVNFAALRVGGDLFSQNFTAIPVSGTTTLSFDYLGTPVFGGGTGGFLGVNAPSEHWYFGTGGFATDVTLIDDGAWNHYSVVLPQGISAQIKLEDWAFADGVAGNAYFDNIQIESVPEPTTLAALGLGGLALLRRRRK